MRLARTVLTVSIVLLGTDALRAQLAHSNVSCGCQACSPCPSAPDCQGCGSTGGCNALIPALSQSLHGMLAGIVPGSVGCDARHKIYRSALQRSTFDKKCLLPVAYYSHILPLWSHHRCCCGPVTSGCPTCGPQGVMGEEVIEMQEYPAGVPMEPTPAMEPEVPPVPEAAAPAKQARLTTPQLRVSTRSKGAASSKRVVVKGVNDRLAHQNAHADEASAEELPLPSIVRQVSGESRPLQRSTANPLR